MSNLKNYKDRFYKLLESQMGNVKPLITEQKSDFAIDRQSNELSKAAGIRSDKDYDFVKGFVDKNLIGGKGKSNVPYALDSDQLFNKYGKNMSVWQKMISLLGGNLGKSGPNEDGVDGNFGSMSRKALTALVGNSITNLENWRSLYNKIESDPIKIVGLNTFISTLKSGQLQKDKTTTNKQKKSKTDSKGTFVDCVRLAKTKKESLLNGKTVIEINGYKFLPNQTVITPQGESGRYYCWSEVKGIAVKVGDKKIALKNIYEPITVKTDVDNKGKEESSGIGNYFRKYFPNVAQMFFTKNLSNENFTENQKKVLFDTIVNAIKRGEKPTFGSTQYKDYSEEIEKELDTAQGASTFKTIMGSISTDDEFKMATTLGRFTYRLNKDGSYTITDNYDFTKGQNYDLVNKKELEGKSYPEKLFYIKDKTGWSLYRASRYIAWTEHPQGGTDKEKITIELRLDPGQYASIQKFMNNSDIA